MHSSRIKSNDIKPPCRFVIYSSKLNLNIVVLIVDSNVKSKFQNNEKNHVIFFYHFHMTIIFHLFICQGLVRLCMLYRIKSHVPLLVQAPVNSLKFQPCGSYIFHLCYVPPNWSLIRKDYQLKNTLL